MYDVILFDVDGTLLDTSRGILLSLEETLDKYGIDYSFLTAEDRETFIGPPMELSMERWFGIKGEMNADICAGYRKHYREVNLMTASPYEGIETMLDDLIDSGFTLGVASYKKQDYLMTILEGFGLDKYFKSICGSDYTGELTKADIIHNCLRELDVEDRSRVLMVGDTCYDSVGAVDAGVDFCFAGWGFGKICECDPVMSCERPADLPALLAD